MIPGDVIFVRSNGGPIDDTIALGEWLLTREEKTKFAKEYVHCAIFLGGGLIAEAQGGRLSGTAPLSRYSGMYDVGYIHMTYDQREGFIKAAQSEYKLPYDWRGIASIALRILTFGLVRLSDPERDSRYCSKFIEWAAEQIGVKLDGYTPETLALDPLVQIQRVA